ncbi:MAG: BMP family ABC transporter substrate-binding protein [Sphingobacteriaceae bacterium]|nr:BMP family ABC transporter substrate-binding protein [Sphingobacteriaceae bacterium]
MYKNIFYCLSVFILLVASSCGSSTSTEVAGSDSVGNLSIGFVYIGSKSDYGYNQAHSEGAAALKNLSGVTVYEEENVPETMDAQKTMESMINMDKSTLIFPTSFGYFDPHALEMAKKYPDVTFLHCGGLYDKSKHPGNVGSYFGYIDEAVYLSGIVAASTSKTKKLGYIAAKPIPQVLRNINAFALGAQSVDPSVTVTVVFTGDWFLPVKEAEAANSLADQGVDVITGHVDSPKVLIETAEKRGIYSVGYHTDQTPLAPKGFLTGAMWNWPKVYTDFVNNYKAGKSLSGLHRGGLKEGIVMLAPYGPAVSEAAKAKAEAIKAEFMSDKGHTIFKGPLVSSTGKQILKAGEELKQQDPILESMDYLVKGVNGSIPAL